MGGLNIGLLMRMTDKVSPFHCKPYVLNRK